MSEFFKIIKEKKEQNLSALATTSSQLPFRLVHASDSDRMLVAIGNLVLRNSIASVVIFLYNFLQFCVCKGTLDLGEYLQFQGTLDYLKSSRGEKKELEMAQSVMEWMMLMISTCSHGQALSLVLLILFMKGVFTS